MDIEGFNSLLKKEVDRKEFVAHLGATALAVIGVRGLLKAFTDPHETQPTFKRMLVQSPSSSKKIASANSYGGGSYGGK